MLNLFLVGSTPPLLELLVLLIEGFTRSGLAGVVLEAGVVERIFVGLLSDDRLVAGLTAPGRAEETVAADVRLAGVGAVAREVVAGRSAEVLAVTADLSVVDGAIDILLGFADTPSLFSSSVVSAFVDALD